MVAAPIQIPLSLSGDPAAFRSALEAHRAALAKHRVGKAGVPAPQATHLIDSLVARIPASGPVATRGPDTFVIVPYEIVDDTPRTEEQNHALQVLRESIANAAS